MSKYHDDQTPCSYEGKDGFVFISYSRKDKEIVYADLREMNKLGVRFWYDDGIAAGEDWKKAVEQKISAPNCVGVVFYLSKNTLFSEAIEAEIRMVFGAESKGSKCSFSVLIDYDNLSFSLSKIIKYSTKGKKELSLLQRASLISNIFGGNVNYLFRSPDPADLSKHFYKMLVRISGFGAVSSDAFKRIMPDYSDFEFTESKNGVTISAYKGSEETVIIPEKICGKAIVRIGDKAFKNNEFLRKVVIPNNVTEIGEEAFFRCIHLNEVDINVYTSKLKTIKCKAFYDCSMLKLLHIPHSTERIEANAFGECEFSDATVETLYFYSVTPPVFDIECVDGSKIYVPAIAHDDYIKATGLKHNIYSVLDTPQNVKYHDGLITWDPVFGAQCYEVDEDDIPIEIVKINKTQYRNIDGLHTIKVRALGNYEKKLLSSMFSDEIICGVTSESELSFNEARDTVTMYTGVRRMVVLPDFVRKIKGSVLIFYNVNELHVPAAVEEIDYETVCGIKKLLIDEKNPFYYTHDGKIYSTQTQMFFRNVILGKTYVLNGVTYDTETHSKVERDKSSSKL